MGSAPQDPDRSHVADLVPYADSAAAEKDRVETFCLLIEALARHRRQLAGPGTTAERPPVKRPASQWKPLVLSACDELFDVPPEMPGEAAVRRQLTETLDRLELYDLLDKSGLDLDLTAEVVTGHLAGLAGGYGEYLTSGVTVSALMPMRPIPFKHIFILGLGEGAFPGRAEASSLDLRLAARRIGDVSLPERNRYLFLEAVLAAREKLYLSFVDRDLQKDQRLAPCSLIKQICRHLEGAVLGGRTTFAIQTVPLTEDGLPMAEAPNPWSDVRVAQDLSARIAMLRSAGLWTAVESRLTPAQRAAVTPPDLDSGLNLVLAPIGLAALTIGQLRRFLDDPVAASLRRHLNWEPEQETLAETAMAVDEPFFTGHPADWNLADAFCQALMEQLWKAPTDSSIFAQADGLFDRWYRHYQRLGYTPEGAFADADAKTLKTGALDAAKALAKITPLLAAAPKRLRAVIIGTPSDTRLTAATDVERLPALALNGHRRDGSTWSAALHGAMPWIWQDAEGTWNGIGLSSTDPKVRGLFAPLLFALAWFCVGRPGPRRFTIHLISAGRIDKKIVEIARQEALAYLHTLAGDFLAPRVPDWMPFHVLHRVGLSAGMTVDDPMRRAFALNLRQRLDESDDPLLAALGPPVPDDALDRAMERFGIFLNASAANQDKHEAGAPQP
jgi:hypothetical protein